MANSKEKSKKVLNGINSMISALEYTTNSNGDISVGLSGKGELNMVNFLIDLFNKIKGPEWLTKALSKFISISLPTMEYSLKGVLLAYVETMLSCSIKPIITPSMIDNGVYFDLQDIDLFNILDSQPPIGSFEVDKQKGVGKYQYFGCENINTIPDLVNCEDFNAVLWYVKNCPGTRVVWKMDKKIVTLEYNVRSSDLKTATNQPMNVTEPVQNCLHVFIGNCVPTSQDKEVVEDKIKRHNDTLGDYNEVIRDIKKFIAKINRVQKRLENDTEEANGHVDEINQCKKDVNKLNQLLNGLNSDINRDNTEQLIQTIFNGYDIDETQTDEIKLTLPSLQTENDDCLDIPTVILTENKSSLSQTSDSLATQLKDATVQIPTTDYNYLLNNNNGYLLMPLIKFNTDLIFSMKWFDEKVVTSQLINAITGCLEYSDLDLSMNGLLSANVSPQAKVIQEQLNDIIEKVIENDDDIINDCFFTFDNETFNQLMQKSEMKRLGLYTTDGVTATQPMSANELLDSINNLPSNATKEEISAAIEHSLFKAVSCCTNSGIDSVEYGLNVSMNAIAGFDLKHDINIVEILIKKLTYVIVATFLTPKVYMIIMFNLKMLGQTDTPFNLMEYIDYCKNMFIDIIKNVKDTIIEYFQDMIMNEINELIRQFSPLVLAEQYKYYKDLLASCLECIKLNRNEYDWAMDDVQYADITEQITSTNDEC